MVMMMFIYISARDKARRRDGEYGLLALNHCMAKRGEVDRPQHLAGPGLATAMMMMFPQPATLGGNDGFYSKYPRSDNCDNNDGGVTGWV